MLMDICDNEFLFNLSSGIFAYAICFFTLLFSILFYIYVKKNISKIKKNKILKLNFVLIVVFLFLLLMIALNMVINYDKYKNCICKYSEPQYLSKSEFFDQKISDLTIKEKNKIIVIGDSRIENIVYRKNKIDVPKNYIMISKSGAGYEWFIYEALPKLYKILDQETDINYYVVMNVGVNDIQFHENYQDILNKYIKAYSNLALKYPNVNFYILSINPVSEDKLNASQPDNIRTNKKIEGFNSSLKSCTNGNNLYYCDSYHDIYFYTNDGLHYTDRTGQDTIDYIKNKCVKCK